MVTKRGVEAAVLVPAAEWRRLKDRARPSLKEFLLAPEGRGELVFASGASAPQRAPGFLMYLLDTNVVSELRRARPHGAVMKWLEVQDDKDLHLSAVALAEIQAGIEITRSQDPVRADEIEAWADAVADSWNILPVDAAIYCRCARLMHGQSDHLYEDALVAATALTHGPTVVTRNLSDFKSFGVRLLSPFDDKR